MDSDQEIPASGDGTLTISIKSGDFDVPLTRAVTADPAATENLITTTQTVIAIFDGDGKLISAQVPELVGEKLTLTKTTTGSDWLASANTVYVVGNVPADMVTTLTGLTAGTDTKATFATAFSLGLTDALNSNTLAGIKVPMFGSASISNAGAGNYTATVNVNHMLAKVSLNSLGVDFSESATPNAKFQPEQVFLMNVPDNISIDGTGALSQAASAKLWHGEVAGSTGDGANNNTGDNHEVPAYATTYTTGDGYGTIDANSDLGTAALAGQTLMSAENPVWLADDTPGAQTIQQYYFYTMPNLTAADAKQQTRLVIRGSWKDNSSAAATEVYYAVPLANNPSDEVFNTTTLDPNKNYKIDVVIKQKGAADAFAELPNDITSVLDITTTITNFSNQEVTIGINGGNKNPTNAKAAKVGDYFYSDGTWSSVYDNSKTLVGLVFSTVPSASDATAGYTHGYVMALKDCVDSNDPSKKTFKWRDYTATESGDKAAGFFNIGTTASQYTDDVGYWAAIKADLDGRTHTATILADADNAQYKAAHAANDYNTVVPLTGTNHSDWYQPSIGQLYALAYNFGGRTAWPGLVFHPENKGNQGAYNEWHSPYFASGADVTTTALNTYLTARLGAAGKTAGTDYDEFEQRVASTKSVLYWSSSDYSAFYVLRLAFHSDGGLGFGCDRKTYAYYVRPVLAF